MRTEETGPTVAPRGTLTGLFIALAVTAGVEIALAARSPLIAKDGVTFIGIAQQLAVSPIETIRASVQHPGYPAMILAARRVIGLFGPVDDLSAWIWAARAPVMLFGLLNVLVFWCWSAARSITAWPALRRSSSRFCRFSARAPRTP